MQLGADRVDVPFHSVELPGRSGLGLRRHGQTVTTWTGDGQVVAIETARSLLLANLHVRR